MWVPEGVRGRPGFNPRTPVDLSETPGSSVIEICALSGDNDVDPMLRWPKDLSVYEAPVDEEDLQNAPPTELSVIDEGNERLELLLPFFEELRPRRRGGSPLLCSCARAWRGGSTAGSGNGASPPAQLLLILILSLASLSPWQVRRSSSPKRRYRPWEASLPV